MANAAATADGEGWCCGVSVGAAVTRDAAPPVTRCHLFAKREIATQVRTGLMSQPEDRNTANQSIGAITSACNSSCSYTYMCLLCWFALKRNTNTLQLRVSRCNCTVMLSLAHCYICQPASEQHGCRHWCWSVHATVIRTGVCLSNTVRPPVASNTQSTLPC